MASEVLFGTRLRTERERRGVSLDQIAQHTKVNRGLFADMERGRFERWPPGIFGRAFIRGYAEVVGLDADATVGEYLALFPEHRAPRFTESRRADVHVETTANEQADRADDESATDDGPLRLVLADEAAARRSQGQASTGVARRIAGAALDAALVLAPAGVAAYLAADTTIWAGAGLGGLAVLVAATSMLGGSPGRRLLAHRHEDSVLSDVFEDSADELYLSPARLEVARDLGDAGLRLSEGDRDASAGRGDLVVSPGFYRPSGARRYGQGARHA
jgi:transcriptional regulator with XRE-family HTH domain